MRPLRLRGQGSAPQTCSISDGARPQTLKVNYRRGGKQNSRNRECQNRAKTQSGQKSPEKPASASDMAFLELVNLRLDYVRAYNSELHYEDHVYSARRWLKEWGKLNCSEIKRDSVERFVMKRKKVSAVTANKEIRLLRATFNFGLKRELILKNPVDGVEFLPTEKKLRYVPPVDDIFKVISAADLDTQDYLWTITETLGRMREINQLTWNDVNLKDRYVVLYTRKKKGGHRSPRKVPMTDRLYEILRRRYQSSDRAKPWVFWHRYWSRAEGKFIQGPYQDRKRLMKELCKRAGVRYFRFHALRHAGASLMDSLNVPIGSIQRILGHENRTTTEIYLHCMSDVDRKAMAVFETARKSLTQTLTRTKKMGLALTVRHKLNP